MTRQTESADKPAPARCRSLGGVIAACLLMVTACLSPAAHAAPLVYVSHSAGAAGTSISRFPWGQATPDAVLPGVGLSLGVDPARQQVYYRTSGRPYQVLRAGLDFDSPQLFLDGVRPTTFAFDPDQPRVFFPTLGGRHVFQADLDTPVLSTTMTGLNTLVDVEFDQRSGRVYMSNTLASVNGHNVWQWHPESSTQGELIDGLDRLEGIAIDPTRDKLVFAAGLPGDSTRGVIYQADLDGSNVSVLVDTSVFGISVPKDVDVVPELNAIVWADWWQNAVYTADLDGSNPRKLFDVARPQQVAVYVPEPASAGLLAWALLCGLARRRPVSPRAGA